ncbi:MAG: PD-(D/E)XK nuclease family protein, partial [Puniceicoccales bacterium]|nr:PD-(D/E)XK nuclease family protein [Puniceicoccales bacterium]
MDDLAKYLRNKIIPTNDAVLLPDLYALRHWQNALRERLPNLSGIQFFTPNSLREELLRHHFHISAKLLPNSFLIPWQLQNQLSPLAIDELHFVRTRERPLIDSKPPLQRLAACGYFTAMAMDEMLMDVQIYWNNAYIIGFWEGSWKFHMPMKLLGNASRELFCYFEMADSTVSVERWRNVWNYSVSKNLENCHEGGLEVFAEQDEHVICELISGKLLSIFASHATFPFPTVAVAFDGYTPLRGLLRLHLYQLGIPFFDTSPPRNSVLPHALWSPWLRYQRLQRRRECLAFLDAKFALQLLREEEWKCIKASLGEYGRTHLSDACGKNLPQKLQCHLSPLPLRDSVETFFVFCLQEFSFLAKFSPYVPILQRAYGDMNREVFLQWMDEMVRHDISSPSPSGPFEAKIHLIDLQQISPCHFEHIIIANGKAVAANDGKTWELWTADTMEKVHTSIDDFYYAKNVNPTNWEEIFSRFASGGTEITIFGEEYLANEPCASPKTINEVSFFRQLGTFLLPTERSMRDDIFLKECIDAHRKRRLPEPYGFYDFSIDQRSPWKQFFLESIPCKAWERAFFSPESVWLRHILSIDEEKESIWDELAVVSGTRTHQILANWIHETELFDATALAKLEKHLSAAVDGMDSSLARAMHSQLCGYVMDIAMQLCEEFSNVPWQHKDVEFPLKSWVEINGVRLWIFGRCDLLLCHGKKCRIIDFKTRPAHIPFTETQIMAGHFLQPLLYGFFFAAQNYAAEVCILSPRCNPLSPEFHGNVFEGNGMGKIFSRLAALQRSLCFGYTADGGVAMPFLAHAHSPLWENLVKTRRHMSGWNGDM